MVLGGGVIAFLHRVERIKTLYLIRVSIDFDRYFSILSVRSDLLDVLWRKRLFPEDEGRKLRNVDASTAEAVFRMK